MSPIESIYDCRLVTLLATLMSLVETLALELDSDPDTLIAEYLYYQTKKVYSQGEEDVLNKIQSSFPILVEALD